jgi:NADH-quinone oxidoreductase subunit J
MTLIFLSLIALILFSLWAVMTPLLLRAAIGLALASAVLAIIMFQFQSPYAAAFELSVCAGLIPVIFISVINLVSRQPIGLYLERRRKRIRRFIYLPFILIAAAVIFSFMRPILDLKLPWPEAAADARELLWNCRRFDLFGQVLALLAGSYGVLILFRRREKNER